MSRHVVLAFSIILVAVVLAPVAPAAAQGLGSPFVERTEEKVAEANEDPVGFAGRQASDEGLADDANWTVAYGCYLGHEASEEAGLPPPEVEPCGDYEEALGIAEEEQHEAEGTAAEAEGLRDAAVVEAEAIAEDAEATAGRILDDPSSVPDEALGLVDRTVRALQRIVDALTVFVDDTVTGLGLGLGAIAKGSAVVLAAPFAGLAWMTSGAHSLMLGTADGILTGIAWAADGVLAAAAAGSDAVWSGGTAAGEAMDRMFDNLRDVVLDLIGTDAPKAAKDGPTGDLRPDLDPTDDRLLDPIGGLVDDTMPR